MRVFFRCVAEAVAENGLKGLAAMIPGGPYAYAIAEGAWRKYRERCALDAQHRELRELAEAKLKDARAEMVVIAREVLGAVPADPAEPWPTADEAIDLELFVAGIPDAVRQSLKRPDDPTGRTVPNGFALRSADDVLKVLPARPPRFRPGDALPGKSGWVLEHLLGMGGFGEVWFTRHARMTSLSGAVKFCFGQSGRDLIHEASLIDRVMQAGRHPNIVPLLDVYLERDHPWLLFEYVAGGNLTDWIHNIAGRPAGERLPQVLAALRQLCEAVSYFHRLPEPIVHRDLKPSNILFDQTAKKLRVTDFGIGSITATETNRQESRGLSARGGRLLTYMRGSCTPLYSSPQQRIGAEPDPRDDVHALGVIAYQMLISKLDAAPGPRAGKVFKEAGVNEALAELLLNCVSEHMEDRPKDAGELLRALTAIDRRQAQRKVAEVTRNQETEREREVAQKKSEEDRLREEEKRKVRADTADDGEWLYGDFPTLRQERPWAKLPHGPLAACTSDEARAALLGVSCPGCGTHYVLTDILILNQAVPCPSCKVPFAAVPRNKKPVPRGFVLPWEVLSDEQQGELISGSAFGESNLQGLPEAVTSRECYQLRADSSHWLCPHCRKPLRIPTHMGGKRVKCKTCGGKFVAP